jgi:hypothetical protein
MERFNVKKLNAVDIKEKNHIEVSIGLQLWKIWKQVEMNSSWEAIRGNINISVKESQGSYEMKKHKQLFDEGCSILLNQR